MPTTAGQLAGLARDYRKLSAKATEARRERDDAIRRAWDEGGWTQATLAEAVELPRQRLHQILKGTGSESEATE